MTTINLSINRGDSESFPFHVTDSNSADVDLTGAVVKFTVRPFPFDARFPRPDNSAALIFKTSYDATQVAITAPTQGRLTVYVDKPDTLDWRVPDGGLFTDWDLEVTRPGAARTGAQSGVIAVTASTGGLVGTGTAFTSAKVGDILVPSGATTPNTVSCTITAITDGTHMTTDYTGWVTATTISFQILAGNVKTPGGGLLVVSPDVTR